MTTNLQVPDDFLKNLDEAAAILGATIIQMQKHAEEDTRAGYHASPNEIEGALEVYDKLHTFLESAMGDAHSTTSDWSRKVERAFQDSTWDPSNP